MSRLIEAFGTTDVHGLSHLPRPPIVDATAAAVGHSQHAVQFYDRDDFLIDAVAKFLAAGIAAGERILVIATPAHAHALRERLGPQGEIALDSERLQMFDAQDTLAQFMLDDMPDSAGFHGLIANLIGARNRDAQAIDDANPWAPVRIYGEMVDVLWRRGQAAAAFRLEELWNEAGKQHPFSLMCAYVLDNFFKASDSAHFSTLCAQHSHVMPTENFMRLDTEQSRLREVTRLQQRARALEEEVETRKRLEIALREALNRQARAEERLRAMEARERDARERAEASDAFNEIFVGILAHDLCDPLNTILTTARTISSNDAPPAEASERWNRVAASGDHMKRTIEQIRDATRGRLASGMPVDRSQLHDVAKLSERMIAEARSAHPELTIALHAAASCEAYIDAARVEQIVANLLDNAIVHGDPSKPITVEVSKRDGQVHVRVHNHGAPIAPEIAAALFEPFKRGDRQGHAQSLGLGLYISERIVSAHGGKIAVHSTAETGTSFEVVLTER